MILNYMLRQQYLIWQAVDLGVMAGKVTRCAVYGLSLRSVSIARYCLALMTPS